MRTRATWPRLLLVAAVLAWPAGRTPADNILRRVGSPSAATSGAPSSTSVPGATPAQQAAQAIAVARQESSPLRQALEAIRLVQAKQAAARGTGLTALVTVPDALQMGGLWPSQGYPVVDFRLWQGAGPPTETLEAGTYEVIIKQNSPRAILTWETFNVGARTHLHFDQRSGGANAASWVALNRVTDPSAAPSQILGRISSDGQVYLINRNGVIFGGNSQINTATLLVSGLDIAPAGTQNPDQRFLNETLQSLSFAPPPLSLGGGPVGEVTVEAGAQLAAAPGGRVVLLGTRVVNGGSISAPDGQVVLAAAGGGDGLALSASGDLTSVRGLAPPRVVDASGGAVVTPDGGLVQNTGLLQADRGNITMVAGQTLQDGMVTATTGAQANGSIWLGADGFLTRLGGSSVTQVLPDQGGGKVIGSGDTFRASTIDLRGDQITLLGGASIYAPAGNVTLSAIMAAPGSGDDTRLYIGAGARIDVSGLRDVPVAMAQNSVKAELRANELADDPLLRDNPALRGRTVWFDGRLGVNPALANLSGYYDLLERDVSQLMTSGGRLSLAANQLITRHGSVIDLSGGNLQVQDGYVKRSVLLDRSGNRVPIESAGPGVAWIGLEGDFVVDHARWGVQETWSAGLGGTAPRFERGYRQGGAAGQLLLSTNPPAWYTDLLNTYDPALPVPVNPSATGAVRILDGEVAASTVIGPYQRQLPASAATAAAESWAQQLQRGWLRQPAGAALALTGASDVRIGPFGTQLPVDFAPDSLVDPALRLKNDLPVGWFDGRTFRQVTIASGSDPDRVLQGAVSPGTIDRAPGGHLSIGAGVTVDLGDGGSFSFTGKSADLEGALVAPGGAVTLNTLQQGADPAPSSTIHVGATGLIDVAGRFSNDALAGGVGPLRALDGGKVSLTASSLLLDPGSLVDVSGGARLDATGAKLTAGKGGAITLDVSRYPAPGGNLDQAPAFAGSLLLAGELHGYALRSGGSLTLRTGFDLVIGTDLGDAATPQARLFTPGFFTHGGFASYTLLGERSLTVTAGTVLAPSVEGLVLVGATGIATGTRLADVAGRQPLPQDARGPMSLSLSTVPARNRPDVPGQAWGTETQDLYVETGARIVMEPGSTLSLASSHVLRVDGEILAPGGTITLEAKGIPQSPTTSTIAAGPGITSAGIYLTDGAALRAGGYLDQTLVSNNQVRRSVEAGGKVVISSNRQVAIASGATIDVAGVQGTADLTATVKEPSGPERFAAATVDGNAGSISITASNGLVDGDLRLAPGGPAGLGGALTIQQLPGASGSVVVGQGTPAALGPGDLGVVAGAIDRSGLDDLVIQAVPAGGSFSSWGRNGILFDGNVDLHARRTLTLVAPSLQPTTGGASRVTLAAASVALNGVSAAALPTVDPVLAGATLTVQADLIDLSRTLVLGCVAGSGSCAAGGFATTRLVASGDIRLSDRDAAGVAGSSPGLLSPGALSLESAQVYVVSRQLGNLPMDRAADDPGILLQAARSITIVGNGNPATFPLSFGERLTLEAPLVDQGGLLRAPQGQLRLVGTGANGTVTLEPGSLTSTSLEGHVAPFGPVLTGGVFLGYDQPGAVPTKRIALTGATLQVKAGSVLDVSGGGDLQGFLFSPGNGGSSDLLDTSRGFAVLPGFGTGSRPGLGAPAPISPDRFASDGSGPLRDQRLRAGDQVWLQGVPGLADGYYTLLPAHYALLAGGLLVQPLGGSFAAPQPAFARLDGSVVVSGCQTSAGSCDTSSGHQVIYGQYQVMPQAVFARYSQYELSSFDQFAAGVALDHQLAVRTPVDAGTVSLDATRGLELLGTGRLGSATGLLGNLDLSAPSIAVLGPGVAAPAGYLALTPQAIEAFGAGSVLLGGTRSSAPDGTALTVNAANLLVDLGPANPWSAPELILAAGAVTVADGSVLRAEGAAQVDGSRLLISRLGGGGDAALLRLSTGARVGIDHLGATGQAGDLAIAGSASLSAAGSLTLDGSRSISLSPAAQLSGRQVDMASTRVNLGDAPAGTPGTTLGAATLATLAASSDLLIRGQQEIDLYGDIGLGVRTGGVASLTSLTFDTGLLQGHGGAATISAATFVLQNSGAPVATAAPGSAGSIALDVDTLRLGPGAVRLAGYAALTGTARLIEGRGTGSLDFAGDLSLLVDQLRTDSGASTALTVGGQVTLARTAGGVTPTETGALGGRIAISGAAVSLDTSVKLPGGRFEARAGGGDLTLGPTTSIDVSGATVDFRGQPRHAEGGTIHLSASGGLAVAAGATLDVSGDAAGGDAGLVELSAGGALGMAGTLRGTSATGFQGGSLALDAGTLAPATPFSSLEAGLAAGVFDGSLQLRLRRQDLTVAAGEQLRAHRVELRADTGQVTVAGTIDAAGTATNPDGGIIRLEGGAGVAVTGTLSAQAGTAVAGGFEPASGLVELVARGGAVDVAPGTVIDVSGGRLGGGSVVVRAPIQGNEVAVQRFGAQVNGARELVIQGEQAWSATAVDAALADAMVTSGSAWLLASRGAITARLQGANPGLAGLQVGAALRVSSAGDLALQSNLLLAGALGEGHLALEAGGSIAVATGMAVGDGFADRGAPSVRAAPLLGSSSSSISLEAAGDIGLGAGSLLRTGTGAISLQAGRDLLLADRATPAGAPAVIYTAGRHAAAADGFLGGPAGTEFPVEGGAIELRAGRDIVAPLTAQTTSAWLYRDGATSWVIDATQSTVLRQSSWSVFIPSFEQGVGALGGGDVRVSAGRDIARLQVSIPTTGQLTTPVGSVPSQADLQVRGGGDLWVSAGGDLLGGLFMLGRGHAELHAAGGVLPTGSVSLRLTPDSPDSLGRPRGVGLLVGLMDATANVTAGADLYVEGAFDPGRQGQVAANLAGGTAGTAFWGYTARTALAATSIGGAVTWENDPWAAADLSLNGNYPVKMKGTGPDALTEIFSRAPPTLQLTALRGGLTVADPFGGTSYMSLAPAPSGTLELLAQGDVRIELNTLRMDEVASIYARGPLVPFTTTGGKVDADPGAASDAATNSRRGLVPLHAADPSPVRIYALEGSVCAQSSGACTLDGTVTSILLPKPVEVVAGLDLVAGTWQAQNNGPADLTLLMAGRDVLEPNLLMAGTGSALVQAGRDVELNQYSNNPTRGGNLYSLGNRADPKGLQSNPALPAGRGTDLYVLAGAANGVAYDAFGDAYLDPANAAGLVKTYLPELGVYMRGLGAPQLSDAAYLAAFRALPAVSRGLFLDQVYLAELRQTGIEHNDPTSPRYQSYRRGFDAVARLFPGDLASIPAAGRGNVTLNAKPLETQADASITVLAPYGSVGVGAQVLPAGADPSKGGVVTRRGGNIGIMADRNIDLYTSRVFTLGGGDVLMWTSDGSITAGSGSKTSVFQAPLQYAIDTAGRVTVDAFGLQTGAGIGVLDALQDAGTRKRSRLDLIAPNGEVNAGDAGVRVVGDLNIAAAVVTGIENIQVSGASAGVPKVEAPNVGALTSASAVAQAASQEGVGPDSAAARNAVADLPSIITVEVIGYESTDSGDPEAEKKKKSQPKKK